MMRTVVKLLILCLNIFEVSAQDLIVTEKGDSINATVIKVENDYVHFAFRYKDEIRRTLLKLDNIEHQKDYFPSGTVPKNEIPGTVKLSKFRFGISGGLSYMTRRVNNVLDPDVADHLRDLKSGMHYGGDVDYFFSQVLGVGLRYRALRTRSEVNDVLSYDKEDFVIIAGRLVDDIRVQTFAVALASKLVSASGNFILNYDMSIGYALFRNAGSFDETPVDITSSSYSWGLHIGADFKLGPNFALGLSGSFISLYFSDFNVQHDGTFETVNYYRQNGANWSHLDIALRMVWYH